MSDDFEADAGSGGKIFASDEIASVNYPRCKLVKGADGTNDGDISNTNPFPVELIDDDNTVVADIGEIAACADGSEMQVDIVTDLPLVSTVDSVNAKLSTDAIMNGANSLTPKYAIIDVASSGDNTLVNSVVGAKIRVLACFLLAENTVSVRFESGASGTALTGQMALTQNSGFALPFNPVGWFETAVNTLLNLELSAAMSVDGCLVYVEV